MNLGHKLIAGILIPFFMLSAGPLPKAYGQEESSDNESTETILIGMFAVVVGILIWLGIRSDYEDWRSEYETETGIHYAGQGDSTTVVHLDSNGNPGLGLEF